MRRTGSAIERFCYRHPRFGIKRLMLYIVIGTALFYVINLMDRSGMFLWYIMFSPPDILRGEVWRLVTWIFYPAASSPLYFYYFIGKTLEQQWGTAKFSLFYLMGALLNIIYGFAVWFIFRIPVYYMSPVYLNLSMFFAFAVLFPDQRFLLFFIFPVKCKWLALIDAAFFLYEIISMLVNGLPVYAVLPLVSVINFFIFCGSSLAVYLRRSRPANVSNTIKFKTAARSAEKAAENRAYRHKCAVCGRTDTDHPELQFRYCSRCQGYHCFCEDHINSHIHFTE